MNKAARTLAFIAQFVAVGLALAFVIGLLWPRTGQLLRSRLGLPSTTPETAPIHNAASAIKQNQGPFSYADAVHHAAPSVVNIYANKVITEQPMRIYSDPLLQQIFGGPAGPSYKRSEQSLGSGVIIGSKGYVVTNNHVIAGAADIQVLLYDGRVAEAKVVGSDADTDLAVLKIDASHLPGISIASTPPQVGDVVLAIGNPFGIGQTVTMGIISALQRQLNSNPEDFIQTDAAINFGNSGGALVNAHGELVGINTALLGNTGQGAGRGGSAEGISFAIPVTTAKMVMNQIIKNGHVIRGWLGIDYVNVPVSSDSGLPAAARGVMVTDVYPGSPAAHAGLRAGDILLRLNQTNITDASDLRRREASLKPGSDVTVSGVRAGATFQRRLTLTQRPALSQLMQMSH